MSKLHHLAIGQLGAAALRGLDDSSDHWTIDLGPEHPSRTGLVLIDVETDDEIIISARIQPGFNHRGAEKLFEVRDHRQVLGLADRHDWHSPFIGELGIAQACERLMGLVPPPRTLWLRVLLAEQARIASHLAHLTFVVHHTGDAELAGRIRDLRQQGRQLVLDVSGNRVHPMMNRLGGLSADCSPHSVAAISRWAHDAATLAAAIDEAVQRHDLGRGVGIIDEELVDSFSLSGPVAAARGIERRLRVTNPDGVHADIVHLLGDVVDMATGGPTGDAAARFSALTHDIRTSAAVAAHCSTVLETTPGPVDTKLSKIIKLPDAETYLALDAPWGMAGFLLVSRAERTPWRLKLRTPSFANVQALERVLVGCPLSQAHVVVASLGWTAGDLDK